MTSTTPIRSAQRPLGRLRVAFALAGALGLSVVATQLVAVPTASASSGLRFYRGYSVQQSWLCYGWRNGAYHCTRHWHRSGRALISDNPAWVPNYGVRASTRGGGGSGGSSGTSSGGGAVGAAPRNIGPWVPPPGLRAYPMADFRGDPYHGYFGACTWYAWYRRQNEPLMRLGMAASWAANARAHGLRVGTAPAVGATVVFQPGVQGASGGGHAAHVEAVYKNGWFLVSEMSFYWNGGGWGRVSFRYAHTGPGVAFIY